jgi:hypothetical protein
VGYLIRPNYGFVSRCSAGFLASRRATLIACGILGDESMDLFPEALVTLSRSSATP